MKTRYWHLPILVAVIAISGSCFAATCNGELQRIENLIDKSRSADGAIGEETNLKLAEYLTKYPRCFEKAYKVKGGSLIRMDSILLGTGQNAVDDFALQLRVLIDRRDIISNNISDENMRFEWLKILDEKIQRLNKLQRIQREK